MTDLTAFFAAPGRPAVTAAEVVAWFLAAGSKTQPMPDAAAVAPLVALLNERIGLEGDAANRKADRLYRAALKSAAEASRDLQDLIAAVRAIPEQPDLSDAWPEAMALQSAIDGFLAQAERRPGRPKGAHWRPLACQWAPAVQNVLRSAGWLNPSMSRDGAVVPFVVSRMVEAAAGERVNPVTVSKFLRSAEGREKTEAVSSA